jgi:hypothetical protein
VIYKVEYLVSNTDKYKEDKPVLPMYIVAPAFKDAMIKALEYESDNLTLLEVKLATTVGNVAVTSNFKGV